MIKMNLDYSDFLSLSDIGNQIESAVDSIGQQIAVQAYSHAATLASTKLHSTKEPFLQALAIGKEDDGTWLLVLDASAMWIEENSPGGSMLDSLLNSPKAKTGKSGEKYLSVPFQQNKPNAATSLTATVANAMSSKGLSLSGIESHANGQPKTGLLHSFDIPTPKGSSSKNLEGPSGIPFLKGVRVYQSQKTDKTGKSKTERFVATFRMASESQRGKGIWDQPSRDGAHIMDETYDWCLGKFSSEWGQAIMDHISQKLGQ